jgi:hypothetical protein
VWFVRQTGPSAAGRRTTGLGETSHDVRIEDGDV